VQNNLVVQKAIAELDRGVAGQTTGLADRHEGRSSGWLIFALFIVGLIVGGALVWMLTRPKARQLDSAATQKLRLELQQWLSAESLEADRP